MLNIWTNTVAIAKLISNRRQAGVASMVLEDGKKIVAVQQADTRGGIKNGESL